LPRLVAQVDDEVKQVPLVAETNIIGGERRQVRVLLDPSRLASRNLSPAGIVRMLQQADRQFAAGGLTSANQEIAVETGAFLTNAEDVGNVVVGVFGGKPVYLRDVAHIVDGAEEPSQYVFYSNGAASAGLADDQPAVTLTIAKRPGANAIDVADRVLKKVDTLKGVLIPGDVQVSTTRNYGETALEKSNELLFHIMLAVLGVSLLILLAPGWRESVIVLIAIPSTLALTLLVFYLYGYTLNRITLFALIFSIGILVDDAIVVVENIVRHFHLPQNSGRPWTQIAVEAVNEVGNPTILATAAVIAAVLPMAFVGGLMGPYMRPIPIGAAAAMFFSLAIAFVATPWAAVRVLRWGAQKQIEHGNEDFFTRIYRRIMQPLIKYSHRRWIFLIAITTLLFCAMALVGIGWVKVKMLPFDNKSEFQIILNMPEGSALEHTVQAGGTGAAPLVPLRELVSIERTTTDKSIYHKNLIPVIYVIGDLAGTVESPVYAILNMNHALHSLDMREFGGSNAALNVLNARLPFTNTQPALKWDGEWHITIEVFRDLGTAFAVVLVLIYLLMVGWFRSFRTPLVVMAAIPFSLVGILPAHGALGAFFSATSMIGFMAGAGIVVRNSIILVDFIEQRLREGMPLAEAVVDAGAVRFRPMLLTAMAVVIGASVILFDPIFQGLAISLMAGEIASLLISRMAVPRPLFHDVQARKGCRAFSSSIAR
jgi:multidrug efflux pump subunit AcrB